MKKKNDFAKSMIGNISTLTKAMTLKAMSKERKRGKIVKGAVIGGLVGMAVGMPIAGAVVGGAYQHEKNKRR